MQENTAPTEGQQTPETITGQESIDASQVGDLASALDQPEEGVGQTQPETAPVAADAIDSAPATETIIPVVEPVKEDPAPETVPIPPVTDVKVSNSSLSGAQVTSDSGLRESIPVSHLLENFIEGAPINLKLAFQNLENYLKDMAPNKAVGPQAAARQQVTLFRSIVTIIERGDDRFADAWNLLLKLFLELADGVFHETHVFRNMDQVMLPEAERKLFMRLLNLIKVTADPRGRQVALRQINIPATMEGLSDQGQQRLLSFYNL